MLMCAGAATTLAPIIQCASSWAANDNATFKSLCSGKLSFYNIHTREALAIRYLDRKGQFDRRALSKLNNVFRCRYSQDAHPIDQNLFLLLDALKTRLGSHDRPYLLISGYRSPQFNDFLRGQNHAVAERSFHLKGMAADINMEGVRLADIRRTAVSLKAGGVGLYSGFVHVDVGPHRTW